MDWIKARLECSVDNVWVMLREQIASDFARWEELRLSKPSKKVQLNRLEPTALMVTRESTGNESEFARVGIVDGALVIARSAESRKVEQLAFRPSFNAAGECRLRHESVDLEIWEVSRMFLERFIS